MVGLVIGVRLSTVGCDTKDFVRVEYGRGGVFCFCFFCRVLWG